MSDFDFDELDKAVAGAIENETPSDNVPTPLKDTNTSTPAQNTPEPVKQSVSAPAIRRASGRFMDVVHPSSDMRSSRLGAQQGGTLSATSRGGATQNGFTPPVAKTAKPEKNTEDDTTDEKLISTAAELTSMNEGSSPVGEWSKPLESPFLPDAKVEKRPLGGNSEVETFASLFEATNNEALLEAPDEPRLEAHTMPDPIDFAAQSIALPSENEDTGAPQEEEVSEESAELSLIEDLPVVEDEPVDETFEEKHEEVSENPIESIEPVGPTSITQQYTEQPSTEQASGAIYDTENYHQPLAHDGKKHSSVWIILGIILLVLLGAGAGVAFYFFILPNF